MLRPARPATRTNAGRAGQKRAFTAAERRGQRTAGRANWAHAPPAPRRADAGPAGLRLHQRGHAAAGADGALPPSRDGPGGDPVPAPPRRLGLAELPSRPSPHRPRRRGPGCRAPVDRVDPAARRGRLRPAARDRPDRRRGHRGRFGLRAGPGDRHGAVAGARRHAGAAGQPPVRQHRPARHHRNHGLQPGHRAGLRGRGDDRVPPRAGGRVRGHRARGVPPRHPHSGRPAQVRPTAGRARAGRRPRVHSVRGVVRGLRALPRLGRERPLPATGRWSPTWCPRQGKPGSGAPAGR